MNIRTARTLRPFGNHNRMILISPRRQRRRQKVGTLLARENRRPLRRQRRLFINNRMINRSIISIRTRYRRRRNSHPSNTILTVNTIRGCQSIPHDRIKRPTPMQLLDTKGLSRHRVNPIRRQNHDPILRRNFGHPQVNRGVLSPRYNDRHRIP